MAFPDPRGTNWGCIAAFVVMLVIGFPILFIVQLEEAAKAFPRRVDQAPLQFGSRSAV
jgi:hypothetical protein